MLTKHFKAQREKRTIIGRLKTKWKKSRSNSLKIALSIIGWIAIIGLLLFNSIHSRQQIDDRKLQAELMDRFAADPPPLAEFDHALDDWTQQLDTAAAASQQSTTQRAASPTATSTVSPLPTAPLPEAPPLDDQRPLSVEFDVKIKIELIGQEWTATYIESTIIESLVPDKISDLKQRITLSNQKTDHRKSGTAKQLCVQRCAMTITYWQFKAFQKIDEDKKPRAYIDADQTNVLKCDTISVPDVKSQFTVHFKITPKIPPSTDEATLRHDQRA